MEGLRSSRLREESAGPEHAEGGKGLQPLEELGEWSGARGEGAWMLTGKSS